MGTGPRTMTDDRQCWHETHFISSDQAAAVGYTVLHWNFCEANMQGIVGHYAGLDKDVSVYFTRDLTADGLIQRMRLVCEVKETEQIVKDAVIYGAQIADTCRQNRNLIAHSWINIGGDMLLRERRNKVAGKEAYPFDVKALREVAYDTWVTGQYLMFVGLFLRARSDRHWKQELPERPTPPRRLETT